MALNLATLVPASSKAKEVATLADVPTHTSGTGAPTSTTESIGSTYENMTDNSLWTFTNNNPEAQYGWVAGGNPDALTGDTVIEAINSNTTTIDGGRINTDSVFANRVFAEDITYTGTITGGTTVSGGIIQSKNYVTSGGTEGMIIDLVNGSIYIA